MDRHGVFYNRLWPPKLLGCRFAWEVGRLGPYIHTVFVRYAICIYIYNVSFSNARWQLYHIPQVRCFVRFSSSSS